MKPKLKLALAPSQHNTKSVTNALFDALNSENCHYSANWDYDESFRHGKHWFKIGNMSGFNRAQLHAKVIAFINTSQENFTDWDVLRNAKDSQGNVVFKITEGDAI